MFLNAIDYYSGANQTGRLTVTKVVFEYASKNLEKPQVTRLTVTKVVFEFKKHGRQMLYHGGLTVTKVVFELAEDLQRHVHRQD